MFYPSVSLPTGLTYMTGQLAKHKNISLEQAQTEMLAPVPAGRFGTPEEFAAACLFLCSSQSGYITGQNLQLDGGAYSGLFELKPCFWFSSRPGLVLRLQNQVQRPHHWGL